MDLKHLSPRQLDRLVVDAARELQRLRNRKPVDVVRRLLRDAARGDGYALHEVFPEFPALASGGAVDAVGERAPASAPVPPPAPVSRPRPDTARSAPASPALPADPGRTLVRAIAKQRGVHAVGMATPLAALMADLALEHDWSAFHSALELAAQRGWVHFRGNDHCVLTDAGFAAAAD